MPERHARFLKSGDRIRVDAAELGEEAPQIGVIDLVYPQIEEGQIKGRAILWDKPIDLEAAKRYRESRVPQPAYVYQNNVGGPPPGSSGSSGA